MSSTRLSIQNCSCVTTPNSFVPLVKKVFTKGFKLEYRIDDILNIECPSLYQERFISKLKTIDYESRQVDLICSLRCDRNIVAEALGVVKYSRDDTLVFSLQDSLDLVLYSLCGVEPSKIRQLNDYKRLSRGLLNMDFELLGSLTFEELLEIDDKLDYYLSTLFNQSQDYADFLRLFFTTITDKCFDLLCIYAERFRDYILTNNSNFVMSPRSADITTIVFACSGELDYELELCHNYFLKVRTFKRKQYVHHVDELLVI